MTTSQHQPGDFIAYPTERVVGTIADAKRARAAIETLLGRAADEKLVPRIKQKIR